MFLIVLEVKTENRGLLHFYIKNCVEVDALTHAYFTCTWVARLDCFWSGIYPLHIVPGSAPAASRHTIVSIFIYHDAIVTTGSISSCKIQRNIELTYKPWSIGVCVSYTPAYVQKFIWDIFLEPPALRKYELLTSRCISAYTYTPLSMIYYYVP